MARFGVRCTPLGYNLAFCDCQTFGLWPSGCEKSETELGGTIFDISNGEEEKVSI